MVIEINKDIDRYQESLAMGLTAKQLMFSVASVIAGGTLVFFLYRYIGLTASAYVAIPVVSPIALGGFYSYNGMDFYEYMGRKLHFMFGNRTLTYVSTENEQVINAYEMERVNAQKSGQDANAEEAGNNSEFEAMRRKMKRTMFMCALIIIMLIVVAVAYKFTR